MGKTSYTTPGDLSATLAAVARHGWQIVLLGSGTEGKKPLGMTWQITDNAEVISAHVAKGNNIGLVCGPRSGVVVVDFDNVDLMEEMFNSDLGPLLQTVETGSGKAHCYFKYEDGLKAKIYWKGQKVGEVQRGGQSILQHVVMPPSLHPKTGKEYEWRVPPEEDIPALPPSWRQYLTEEQGPSKAKLPPIEHGLTIEQRIEAATRWLEQRAGAVQGMHGDIHTYITVASVVFDHDLDDENAYKLLSVWNQKCVPPWTEKDLHQKIRSAKKSATGARGEKLLFYERTPIPEFLKSYYGKHVGWEFMNYNPKVPIIVDRPIANIIRDDAPVPIIY